MPHPVPVRRGGIVAVLALVLVLVLVLMCWPAPSARAAWSGDPADVAPGRADATLAGHLVVRDGGSPEGGRVIATHLDSADGLRWGYDAVADESGAWSVDVPAGRYELQATSRYGLQTSWPDLPPRLGARPISVGAGETRGDLDFSMRLRLPQAAQDEFGWTHVGWNDEAFGSVLSLTPYPRDTRRSVTAVRGPVAEVDGPRPPHRLTEWFPATSEFRFPVGADAVQFEYDLLNTGDGVLWTDDVHVDDAPGELTTCGSGSFLRCADYWIPPGGRMTFPVTIDVRGTSGPRVVTLVVPNNAGPALRVPVRLVPDAAPVDPAPAPRVGPAPTRAPAVTAPVRVDPWTSAVRATVVRRTSVRLPFPAAGRVVVRIDRPARFRARGRAPWRTVRTVHLRAGRAGLRTERMARLATGRYRVRLDATAAAGGRHRLVVTRSIR